MLHMLSEDFKQNKDRLPFIPVTIGVSEKQGRTDRPNGFDVHQFLWVIGGEGIFTAEGNTVKLTDGHGFFSRKNVPHCYQSSGGAFDTMWVTFQNGEYLLDYYHVGDSFFFDVPGFLTASTKHLMEMCSRSSSRAILSAHGYAWAAELLDALFQKPLSGSEKVTLFLQHNYDKPLTLSTIAEHAGMDRFSLCRSYAKDTGETVMQALKKIRMQKAKDFLRYSSYSVEQIGKICGYESSSYFIKVFREDTNCTPLQYRLNRWQQNSV
jgi:AraC-like DNA-binding protein